MKTQTPNADQGTLQFTRMNLGRPVPRRTSVQDMNDDTQETNAEAENEEDIREAEEEEKETEGPDQNERIKDGFEWQEDR